MRDDLIRTPPPSLYIWNEFGIMFFCPFHFLIFNHPYIFGSDTKTVPPPRGEKLGRADNLAGEGGQSTDNN